MPRSEAGVTLIDTADVYGERGGSEEALGAALEGRRDQVVLATKWGSPMGGPEWEARGSRSYIRRAVEASLRRLRTDWIDLYQYHVPDEITPIEETLEALHDVVKAGKARYIGASAMWAWAVLEDAVHRAAERLDEVRLDAGRVQPDHARGGAGDDPAVPRPGHCGDSVEPARTRAARRQSECVGRAADDAREDRRVRGCALHPGASTLP